MQNHINIRIHNRKSLEIKLEYTPEGAPDTSDYNIDLLLFFPSDMDVNEATYEQKHFWQDMTRNIRLKTPDFYLNNYYKKLKHFDETCPLRNEPANCEYLYKKYVCGYRAMLRNHTLRIDDKTPQAEIDVLLDHVGRTRKIFRKLMTDHGADDKMFLLGDEFTSIVTNVYLVRLYDRLTIGEKGKILSVIREELEYRKEHYPQSTAGDQTRNEELIVRYEWLKNYFYTVLHLKAKRKKADRTSTNVLYAVAAGVSMIFATVITFWSQQRYGNFTLPFFAALVIGYMFKDRIKDGVRDFLRKTFSQLIYDFETVIYESRKQYAMGKTFERAKFITLKDIPEYARNGYDPNDSILYFNKKVRIEHKKITTLLDPEINGVTDIMRFNINRIISGLEEPLSLVYSVTANGMEKEYVERTYNINVLLRVSAKEKTGMIRGILTVSAKGIKRFKEI